MNSPADLCSATWHGIVERLLDQEPVTWVWVLVLPDADSVITEVSRLLWGSLNWGSDSGLAHEMRIVWDITCFVNSEMFHKGM